MSEYITVVIEYKDGDIQPSFHAKMEVLGGVVTAVMFDDALKRLEEIEEDENR